MNVGGLDVFQIGPGHGRFILIQLVEFLQLLDVGVQNDGHDVFMGAPSNRFRAEGKRLVDFGVGFLAALWCNTNLAHHATAAAICGVARQTIYDWINERRVERLIDALRLSRASGVAIKTWPGTMLKS